MACLLPAAAVKTDAIFGSDAAFVWFGVTAAAPTPSLVVDPSVKMGQ